MPSGPQALLNASVLMLIILLTSRPDWISSFMVTSTPLPRASLLLATATALYRFSMPSADIAVPGRMEPTTMIGFSVFSTRFRKYAVSSRVSVPWVITMPSTSLLSASSATRRPSCSRFSLVMLSEAICMTCSPRTLASWLSSGTPAINCSMPTFAA
ncbi:hypothetical protein D3C86_1791450 [compost metagenome]